MEIFVDHYAVLGLPSSGHESSEPEINRAYRSKVLELHPDKRPGDTNAHANFVKLQNSYSTLKDPTARKTFHDLLRAKRDKIRREGQRDSKRRRMVEDLEKRERSAADSNAREFERIARKLKDEIEGIRAMQARKMAGRFERDKREEKKELDPPKVSNSEYYVYGDDFEDLVLENMRRKRVVTC